MLYETYLYLQPDLMTHNMGQQLETLSLFYDLFLTV